MKYKSIKVGVSLCIGATLVFLAILSHKHGFNIARSQRSVDRVLNYRLNVSMYHGQPSKKFAYLTQTEGCLPKYLQAPQQLGNSSSCQCDILVLSYKQKCNDSSLQLPHLEYIFDPDTTWTTGRNLLYRTVMKREQKYLYYTFMDDDVSLIFKEKPQRDLNQWREYEKALLQMRPFIGVSCEQVGQTLLARYYKGECYYPDHPVFLTYTWYDALFNSFHHKIVNHLLPYYDKLDYISVWYSQVFLMMKTDIMFPNQVFHHVKILARNALHRPYPRRADFSDALQKYVAEHFSNELPVEYKELLQPRLQKWVENVTKIMQFTDVCPLYPATLGTTESDSELKAIPYAYLSNMKKSV